MQVITSIVGAVLLMVGVAVAQGQETMAPSRSNEAIKVYLRSYLSRPSTLPPDITTKITTARVRAENGKAEDVVYVSGKDWCGSGGCTLLILEPTGSTFKVLGRTTIVQLPVRLLPSSKDGYPDIGVTVQGGGILAGYYAALSFNGKSYHRNPSLPPARKTSTPRGKVIIADTEGSVFLYE